MGISSIFFYFSMKVCCMFSLEAPQYTNFNINTKSHPKLQPWDFFQGTQERVRNSRGKLAISVRAIKVLLYLQCKWVRRQ